MKQLKLVLILLLVTFLGCNDEDMSQLETNIDYIEIAKSALYGNGEEGISQSNMVIRNETDWEKLKNQMDSYNDVTDNFNETDIDFDANILIAVFLEIKRNGYEVNIKKVTQTENIVSVSTTENAFMSSVICQPFCIIKIPKTEKNITFE
ncbi:protease complex subunit PrcB family protein [Marinifilum flexuosum]|uniref:Protease stability complex PrcB-like protein n=1 Tax=Marinifilum flexuosum TaxID=1117708 RepID=A0A419X4J1_9BACT|nr:protease complex subunit PrcB family protein [Marinifilum flexuosum]RKE02539.1 hypothetical protein BXY64_2634 [Marinifilum flexuosum]